MNYLFERVDNTKLVFFRILFGFLMMLECWGAIATGWVEKTFVNVDYTFNFIGFEWTHFLLGEPMYFIYGLMGFLGFMVMIGAFYRVSSVLLFLLWTLTYFMQKSNYNNHYYFLVWISFFMAIVPAHQFYSVDASLNTKISSNSTPRWTILIFQIQLAILYFFAAVAKLYPGWLDNHYLPLRLEQSAQWFLHTEHFKFMAKFLRNPNLAPLLAYGGIAFDFLFVPLLIFKPTRKLAFFAALIFHLFNSVTLHVGIFPYLALAMSLFFFDTKTLKKEIFPFKSRAMISDDLFEKKSRRPIVLYAFVGLTLLQIYLPLRHWLIPDDVLWTEEGHRMAWRMMLRTKSGEINFETHLPNGKIVQENLYEFLRPHQINGVQTKPDFIWQYAQELKKRYQAQGIEDVKIYAKNSCISVNGGPCHPFVNPKVDLAHTKWSYFGHQTFILPSPKDYYH
ncbi:HTTM domain-containing protein [Ornithobacterium rhinotracheale]|uniref:HTTM domain-containing protein n=1 Tax=Ornithobacterium rhinotracheale TaxID=28251 RepID=UPI00129C21F4|nr:HTTM domain-containing protein [Ornithobacterium rhinotracheale]MRI63244.1 HTTM domain-containing protein [Ornithobacterium rhinotracheale]